MAANGTLLCILRNTTPLSSLQESGYELVTATTGHDGLRLFASQPVDGIVLEYHLGLLDGSVVADEIKRIRPTIPIVMLADDLELPDGALKSVDALVTRSDGAHFLCATVHFVTHCEAGPRSRTKVARSIAGTCASCRQAPGQTPPFADQCLNRPKVRAFLGRTVGKYLDGNRPVLIGSGACKQHRCASPQRIFHGPIIFSKLIPDLVPLPQITI